MEGSVTNQPSAGGGMTISNIEKFIDTLLRPNLPHSLPLLRRCQFHVGHKHFTPNAEIWVVGSNTSRVHELGGDDEDYVSDCSSAPPWVAAHIDVTVSGQTQVWVFASWEAAYGGQPNPAEAVKLSRDFSAYRRLFNALFTHLQQNHVPKLGHAPPEQWQRLKENGKIVSEPFSRSKVLFGTVAECLWPFFDGYGGSDNKQAIAREDRPYLKYVVTSSKASLNSSVVPPGLHFAPMEERHLQTIVDRTNIPRTIETLRQLTNIGLFDQQDVPIAWGLLGKDASISSLHTEPEYRGRGLAELVSRHLIAQQIQTFPNGTASPAAQEVIYSHADVSVKNVASNRVMEKIGGKVVWRVAWLEIDLGEE